MTWASRDQPIPADRKPMAPLDLKRALTQTEPSLQPPFQASAKLHNCLSLSVNPKPFTGHICFLRSFSGEWRQRG